MVEFVVVLGKSFATAVDHDTTPSSIKVYRRAIAKGLFADRSSLPRHDANSMRLYL